MNLDDRIDDLLDEYEDAWARGERISVDELCRECPELKSLVAAKVVALEEVQAFFADSENAGAASTEDTIHVAAEITELKRHAQGGLGVVYRATEKELNRQVAVKFIHRSLIDDPDSRHRFALEAEVTGRLEHPGVVPLYGIGRADDGRMFYCMRFIDGETMDSAIRRFHQNRPERGGFAEHSIEFRRLLTSFVSLCKTIAYAHNRGIVHRDIKPSNVMLGKYGETIVVDWGLALPVDRDERFLASGEVSLRPKAGKDSQHSSGWGDGTPAYMSPEQVLKLEPSPASDIYSLGATLYKILTGKPSVAGDTKTEVQKLIINGKIAAPRQRLSSVPASLEAICLHAMSLHSQDRYATALDLAEDIENYLADARITVYDEPVGRRVARWARKHRMAAQTAVVGLVAVLTVITLSALWLGNWARVAQRAEQQANHHLDAAELARDDALLARKRNLELSAKFFAESLGDKIDKRWRVLETLQTSPELKRLLAALNENPDDSDAQTLLQAWITDRKEVCDVFRNERGNADSSWVVFHRHGRLLARSPKASSINHDFPHRDYFHGFGRDLTPDDRESVLQGREFSEIKPFEFVLSRLQDHERQHAAHVSAVFQSTSTNSLMVCFTVPVWDAPNEVVDRNVIGVLSIGVELQNLDLPSNVMMFQVKEDQLQRKRGMVISHRLYHSRTEPFSERNLPPYVDGLVEQSLELMNHRLRFPHEPSPVSSTVDDFVDPVVAQRTGVRQPCFAAFEPVVVRSRPRQIASTGWVVVVTEEAVR
jgi:eukaryotic-like serine/threonine-protein kinase